jgi:hypothetical protein
VHFRNIGAQGTLIGPGSLAMAHKSDEFVPINEFVAASPIYRDVALDMLKLSGAHTTQWSTQSRMDEPRHPCRSKHHRSEPQECGCELGNGEDEGETCDWREL